MRSGAHVTVNYYSIATMGINRRTSTVIAIASPMRHRNCPHCIVRKAFMHVGPDTSINKIRVSRQWQKKGTAVRWQEHAEILLSRLNRDKTLIIHHAK